MKPGIELTSLLLIIVIVLVSTLSSTMSIYDRTCGITALFGVFLEKNKHQNLRDFGAKFRWSTYLHKGAYISDPTFSALGIYVHQILIEANHEPYTSKVHPASSHRTR